MTSRERLLTAMRCQQPDRVPIHVRGVGVWQEGWLQSKDASFEPLAEAVREHCDLVASWSPPAGAFCSSAELETESRVHDAGDWQLHESIIHTPKGDLTATTQVSKHDYPSLSKKFWVESKQDLQAFLSLPYGRAEPDVSAFFAREEQLGGRGVTLVGFSDPIAHVHNLLGSELLAEWSLRERKIVRELVALFLQRLLDLIRLLLAKGVVSVYGFSGAEYAGPPLMSPRDFREFVTEPMKALCEAIRSAGGSIHVHCHGPMQAVLEDFREMGASCLHPIEPPPSGDMPLAEAKQRIGREVCLEGNIQVGDLYSCDTTEIRAIVRQAIADGRAGGGFILCPSASPYTRTLPPLARDNYLAMIETAAELGEY